MDTAQETFAALRRAHHGNCFVCGSAVPKGLGLDVTLHPDGSVSATFPCDDAFTGYDGRVHGGTLASLMDGAMVNCLFARGLVAYTAELQVRYRRPVRTAVPAQIRAWVERSGCRLHVLRGEILQEAEIVVTARGKFLELPAARVKTASSSRS